MTSTTPRTSGATLDGRAGRLRATGPLTSWRTVDLLTITFPGAALGIVFWGWGQLYNGPITALKIGYAPAMGLFAGMWFLSLIHI